MGMGLVLFICKSTGRFYGYGRGNLGDGEYYDVDGVLGVVVCWGG